MDNRTRRNGVNMAKVLSRKKYVCICMFCISMYVSCEKDGEMHVAPWNMLYNVYNLCLEDDLIYEVVFKVFHHTESPETFYSYYF